MIGRVVVAGVGRSGAATLIDALAVVDPGLRVERWSEGVAAQASVGLLVIDPSSVAGESERALLDELRASVGAAAIVCTKVDAFWDWPTIAKASRRVLDPAEALPVFAVSGAAAVAGAADESGVDELARWIREHLEDVPRRVDARAPVARAPVGDASDRRPLSATTPVTVAALTATRARLVRSRDRGRADRLGALRGGLNRLRSEAVAELDAGIRDIGARSRDAIGGLRRADVDRHATWLASAVTELRDRLDARVHDDLDRIRSVTLLGVEAMSTGPASVPKRPPIALRPHTERRRAAEDALVVVLGASAGIGIGRLVVTPLAGVHTLQWISMPLALIVGVAMAALVVRLRRVGALRAQMRSWSAEALAESRASIEHDVVGAVTAAEPVIAGQVMRHHERRSRMIADEVARVDADIRAHRAGGRDGTPIARAASNTSGPA
ncbi:hypothetical protein [Williamsia phyllosphaerae]|uniref:Uncharacterized protein n=1 Tax=Williamsia phyllosphaerae TaxID=885042 RepID=A0ABQ1UCF0_9NOCA|nr:hypothetical protein [Williamsia phyllosphaerae]GGF14071.1 hypothetical protein GCM10007298_07580 [Williamsia phyllosphaerae]